MMKKYIAILGLGILGLTFSSCEKEPSFNYPEGTVGGSKVTVYATLNLVGAKTIVVVKGGTFADPGVTAFEGTTPLKPVISGTVNTNTIGVYKITYTATNKDGFPASVVRNVVVADTKADAVANDFSGTYKRTTNGAASVWTKVGAGVYFVVDPGGANSTLSVFVLNPTGNQILIPEQAASDGSITSSSGESYNPATGTYQWIIVNPGYGTAPRTFVKQ